MIITPLFVIFLSIVFILLWVFINTIDKRKWLSFIISLVLTPIAYFYLFYPVINIFSSYHHKKYFNAEAWKSKPALRYEMSNQLITGNLLIGKNKDDINNLLGNPEWFSWDEKNNANSQDKWNYNMGFTPGAFNNMQECIEIQFINNTAITVKPYQLEKEFE